jgi:tRNA(Ile2)-agmatinylcytidine synthase
MWIGVDDTDSVHGGCTTYLARLILEQLTDHGFDIIGYPRLVRLNPNIPWKTRGNGAIALQAGRGRGPMIPIADLHGRSLQASTLLKDDVEYGEYQAVHAIVNELVNTHAFFSDKKTNPGVVILQQQPDPQQYYETVSRVVSLDRVRHDLITSGALHTPYKNGRGLIGAMAAIAWAPKDSTYEIICYREKSRWGTPRGMDGASVMAMDKAFPSTFDNYDYRHRCPRISPHSPCPILFGIRGENPTDLLAARSMIVSEAMESWVLFHTNQGTDDHILRKSIKEIGSFESVAIQGRIAKPPRSIHGGHVVFALEDVTGMIPCAAYEPTKEFRVVARELRCGDEVVVYGGVREEPRTVNLEKLQIIKTVEVLEKEENPVCPKCRKHMKSRGHNQGFQCVICGRSESSARYRRVKRSVAPGWYEVPVCVRRHLSKPLKRMFPAAPPGGR